MCIRDSITAFDAPAGVLWTETAGMLLGRLEIYVVLLAAARAAGCLLYTSRCV